MSTILTHLVTDMKIFGSDNRNLITKFTEAKPPLFKPLSLVFIMIGPLCRLCGMRIESYHKLFNEIAKAYKNFISISKTLTFKNQLHFAYITSELIDPQLKYGMSAPDLPYIRTAIAADVTEKLTISLDMRCQKRGNVYCFNSFSGHNSMIGVETGINCGKLTCNRNQDVSVKCCSCTPHSGKPYS
ncbi:hypothetical protein B566_EDAN016282 [Ephemera danica]|nr:hypothetical protein B566_EDAN016282 [Ephemera danica]